LKVHQERDSETRIKGFRVGTYS